MLQNILQNKKEDNLVQRKDFEYHWRCSNPVALPCPAYKSWNEKSSVRPAGFNNQINKNPNMKISIFFILSLIEASIISNTYTNNIELQQQAKFSAQPARGFTQQLVAELAKDGNFDIAQKFASFCRSGNASRIIRNRQRRNFRNFLRHHMNRPGRRSNGHADRNTDVKYTKNWIWSKLELKFLLLQWIF